MYRIGRRRAVKRARRCHSVVLNANPVQGGIRENRTSGQLAHWCKVHPKPDRESVSRLLVTAKGAIAGGMVAHRARWESRRIDPMSIYYSQCHLASFLTRTMQEIQSGGGFRLGFSTPGFSSAALDWLWRPLAGSIGLSAVERACLLVRRRRTGRSPSRCLALGRRRCRWRSAVDGAMWPGAGASCATAGFPAATPWTASKVQLLQSVAAPPPS